MMTQKSRARGVRLTEEQRQKLSEIAAKNYQRSSNLIRIAVDQLIQFANDNDGKLPTKPTENNSKKQGPK